MTIWLTWSRAVSATSNSYYSARSWLYFIAWERLGRRHQDDPTSRQAGRQAGRESPKYQDHICIQLMSVDFISWLEVGDAFYILEWYRRATPGSPRPALHRKVIKQLAWRVVEWWSVWSKHQQTTVVRRQPTLGDFLLLSGNIIRQYNIMQTTILCCRSDQRRTS